MTNPMPIKVALVDDEPLALEYLQSLVADLSGVEIVGTYRNGREAISGIADANVDLLFLDVQMPGLDGFQVVEQLQSDAAPLIVFATAYDEFALKAFELNAVDYVLKPFDPARIATAVERARERLASKALLERSKSDVLGAIDNLQPQRVRAMSAEESLEKLPIKDGSETHFVAFEDIGWIDAAGDYMCVHAGGQTHILRSTMKELSRKLPDIFVRIHRSTIVNARKITSAESLPKGESLLHLDDGVSLKVSRNFRQEIRRFLN